MTRPHEETWEHHPKSTGASRLYSDNHEEEWATVWGDDNRERARLAAQAPAMARLLLEGMTVTAAGPHDNYETCLAGCGGYGPTAEEHRPDCRLVAVLRTAGVLE